MIVEFRNSLKKYSLLLQDIKQSSLNKCFSFIFKNSVSFTNIYIGNRPPLTSVPKFPRWLLGETSVTCGKTLLCQICKYSNSEVVCIKVEQEYNWLKSKLHSTTNDTSKCMCKVWLVGSIGFKVWIYNFKTVEFRKMNEILFHKKKCFPHFNTDMGCCLFRNDQFKGEAMPESCLWIWLFFCDIFLTQKLLVKKWLHCLFFWG